MIICDVKKGLKLVSFLKPSYLIFMSSPCLLISVRGEYPTILVAVVPVRSRASLATLSVLQRQWPWVMNP